MRITYARRGSRTGRMLSELMPEELCDTPLVLNLGNSNFDEQPYLDEGYDFINRSRNIKNCVNKKSMFLNLIMADIPCLDYYDLEELESINHSYLDLLLGKTLLLRSPHYRDYMLVSRDTPVVPFNPRYTYATKLEDKLREWRIIVFNGRIFRDWEKTPLDPTELYWHKENCVFSKVRYPNNIPEDLALRSALALGMDLCGVDILENKDHDYKVIEVNSSMALSETSVLRLYRRIMRSYDIEPYEDCSEQNGDC